MRLFWRLACQLSKHSQIIPITLPKRFPSVFLNFQLNFASSRPPTSPRSCWDFNSFPMVFLRFSYELCGNRLPTFKAFLKNFKHFAKEVSCSFLKTFNWILLPAGLQLHHEPVEISIRFLWFSEGFLMNCKRIACQFSKHSSIIFITLPKRFPSLILRLSIEFRFQQDSNFTTILLRFQFVFYGFL